MSKIESVTADKWRVDFDERGVATLYRHGEKVERGMTNDTWAFAWGLMEARTEIERLKAINAEHCRAIGILTIDGDRLTRERDEAIASGERQWQGWLKAERERDAALAKVERMDAALARWEYGGCPVCHGDCSAANPPITMCIMQETRAARKDQP